MVRILLEAGANRDVSNHSGETPISIAPSTEMTKLLLESLPVRRAFAERKLEIGSLSSYQREACASFHVSIRDFYLQPNLEETYICEYPSVERVIYKEGNMAENLNEIFADRQSGSSPSCRWYHIPLNNVGVLIYAISEPVANACVNTDGMGSCTPFPQSLRPSAG